MNPSRLPSIALRIGPLTLAGLAALAALLLAYVPGAYAGYPAGAQYPRRIARPQEFVRTAHTSSASRAASSGAAQGMPNTRKPGARKPGARKPDPTSIYASRATLGYEAMQSTYYIPGSNLYAGEPYSFLWPFSQALAVSVSIDELPHLAHSAVVKYGEELRSRITGLEKYWGPAGQTLPGQPTKEEEEEPPEEGDNFVTTMPSFNGNVVPPGGASYYDDNEWVALELVRLYRHTYQPALLERAEQVMAFVMAGWQTNPKLACVGGVPFSDSPDNTDRNTITNAPAAELGVQLYRITGNLVYLRFAETAYQWVRTCLLQPSGMYSDHIRTHGTVVEKLWSYTQGTMIGAGTMLYQITGNPSYLAQARQTAKAALGYFTAARLYEENPFFPLVYFRNLIYLDSLSHDPTARKLAQEYANHVWDSQRLKNNLYAFGSPPASELLYQASVVQLDALLAETPSSYF